MQKKKISLTHYIFIGLILGALTGWLVGEPILPYAEFFAEIFLNILRMAIMPLIITSIVSGVVSVGDAVGLGRLGLKTFSDLYSQFVFRNYDRIDPGNIFQPGVGAKNWFGRNSGKNWARRAKSLSIPLIIPENPFQAMASGDVLPVIFF